LELRRPSLSSWLIGRTFLECFLRVVLFFGDILRCQLNEFHHGSGQVHDVLKIKYGASTESLNRIRSGICNAKMVSNGILFVYDRTGGKSGPGIKASFLTK